MVEITSILIGMSFVLAFAVLALSYYALYLRGARDVSESEHYINTRDVETSRRERVRGEELVNTEASIQDERPVPQIGRDEAEDE